MATTMAAAAAAPPSSLEAGSTGTPGASHPPIANPYPGEAAADSVPGGNLASPRQHAEAGPSRIPVLQSPGRSGTQGSHSVISPSAVSGNAVASTDDLSIPESDAQIGANSGLNEEHAQLLASLAAGHQLGLDLGRAAESQSVASQADLDSDLAKTLLRHTAHQSSLQPEEQIHNHGFDDEDGDEEGEEDDAPLVQSPQGPIQAYAKIDFPGFSIYLQTLRVTIGRRPAHLARAYSAGYPRQINGSTKVEGDVDIDLGKVKAISRLHAVIYYHTGPFQPQPYPGGGHPDAPGLYGSFWREPNQQLKDLFVMEVLGKHGAMVDDVYIRQGGIIQLGKRTKIQIAERVFYFVLPPNVVVPQMSSQQLDSLSPTDDDSIGASDEGEVSSQEEEDSDGSDSSELSNENAVRGASYAGEGSMERSKSKGLPKLILKRKGAPGKGLGGKGGKGSQAGESDSDMPNGSVNGHEISGLPSKKTKSSHKRQQASEGLDRKSGKGKDKDEIERDKALPDWAKGAGVAGTKRKRGGPTSDEEALAVGTPIGVEALEAEKRARAAKKRLAKAQHGREAGHGDSGKEKAADRIEEGVKRENDGHGQGQGQLQDEGKSKSGGKSSNKSNKSVADPTSEATAESIDLSEKSITPATQIASGSVTSGVSSAVTTADTPVIASASAQSLPNAASTAPPGLELVKPPFTNVELITAALRSPECVDGRGKMTMLEVFDWLQKRWPWFKYNGKLNGKDWQNSLKSTFPSSKDFTKIPRKPGETGKGNLYTMSDSPLAVRHREEVAEAKAKAALLAASENPEGVPPASSTEPTPLVVNPKAPTGAVLVNSSSSEAAPKTALQSASPVRGPAAPAATAAAIAEQSASALFGTSSPSSTSAPTPGSTSIARPPPTPSVPVSGSSTRPASLSASPAPMAPALTKAASPSTPGGTPKPQQSVPLVVGAPPANAVIPNKGKPAPGSVEALLDAPPIVHHGGKLYLSAPVFGHLSAQQLTEIEKMGPQKALQTLQGLLVEHLKFKVRQQQLASQSRGQPLPTSQVVRPGSAGVVARPFQTAQSVFPVRSVPPGHASYTGPAGGSPQRPQPQPHSNASPVPVPTRPYTQVRPATSPAPRPNAPGPYPYQQQPLVRPESGYSTGRPGTPAPPRPYARPPTAVNQARPPHPVSSNHRPPATASTTPHGSTASPRPPPAFTYPPGPRPPSTGTSRPPSAPYPSTPGTAGTAQPYQAGRPPPARPYAANGNSNGNNFRPLSHVPQSPLEALQALSSHPEAAGLMALLKQQGQTPGEAGKNLKLTPGQIQLLQMANAMAAAGGSAPSGNGSGGATRPTGSVPFGQPPSARPPAQTRPTAPIGQYASRPPGNSTQPRPPSAWSPTGAADPATQPRTPVPSGSAPYRPAAPPRPLAAPTPAVPTAPSASPMPSVAGVATAPLADPVSNQVVGQGKSPSTPAPIPAPTTNSAPETLSASNGSEIGSGEQHQTQEPPPPGVSSGGGSGTSGAPELAAQEQTEIPERPKDPALPTPPSPHPAPQNPQETLVSQDAKRDPAPSAPADSIPPGQTDSGTGGEAS